jgi:hypothetical protein
MTFLQTSLRAALLTSLAAVTVSFAQAASAPAANRAETRPVDASSWPQPTIERIRIEDAGSRVDELRVGGETQNITVQPKAGGKVPYEVKPAKSAKGNPPSASNGDTNGSRVWNVLKF